MRQLLAMALIGSVATSAFAAKFGEAPGDLNAPMTTYGNPNADLLGVEITNDQTNLYVTFTTNSTDITNPNWIKLNMAMRKSGGFLDNGSNVGWGRAFGISGGANMFLGGWVDGGGGVEARQYDGTAWPLSGASYDGISGMSVAINGGSVTYTIPLAIYGLAIGDTFVFDATTTGGTDPDGAWDPISITTGQITAPDQSSTLLADHFYRVQGEAGIQTLTGTVNLNDVVDPFAVPRGINYKVRQNGLVVGSGYVMMTSGSSAISIELPASVVGAATVEFDGSSFLLRKLNINATQLDQNIGSVSLQNGDVDDSGEVDAADIDAVIADFGGTSSANTDVDVSGEVDAADIDIVIANFGGTND